MHIRTHSPWAACLAAGMLVFLCAGPLAAQPPDTGGTGTGTGTKSKSGTTTPPTATPTPGTGGTGTGGGGASGGGGLGLGLLTREQSQQLLADAIAVVEELAELVPLSELEQFFLVFILYQFERLRAIQELLSGEGNSPASGGGSGGAV